MKEMKCICKNYNKGFINLKCGVHVVMPKIDKKYQGYNPKKDGEIIMFDNKFW